MSRRIAALIAAEVTMKGTVRALLGAGFAALAIGAAPVSYADDDDDRYIQLLDNEGIGHRATRDELISLGHLICDDLGKGRTPVQEMEGLYGSADLSEHDAAALVGGAMGAYCPQYSSEIQTGP